MIGHQLRSVILFLLVAQCAVAGTTGKIAGVARDAKSGEPLPAVNVVVEGTRMGSATSVDGYYVILNVPPGSYRVIASLVGYKSSAATSVRVDIDQTTELDFRLSEETIAGEEITVVASRPVVQKDVAASRLNIEIQDVTKLPVSSVASAVSLQAGVQSGLVIRGGSADQTAWIVDGAIQREGRGYSPNTLISLAAVQDIQVQTGGFTAEYGDLRSGVVGVVTREGDRSKYSISIQSRYSPAAAKHFGPTLYDRNSYWIRPYVDDAVAWTGTSNGAWDAYTRRQYPAFGGWYAKSQELLKDNDPTNDLSPEAAQRLFLYEHRREAENKYDDWDVDFGAGGPVPMAEALGNLRFFYSYKKEVESYIVPLRTAWYEGHSNQLRLTADLTGQMKLAGSARWGMQEGTNSSRAGDAGIFRGSASVARGVGRATGSYIDARIFASDYFNFTSVYSNSQDLKLSHALSGTTFYEVVLQRQADYWNTNPPDEGQWRDTSRTVRFGESYYVDGAPFYYFPTSYYNSTGITGLRTAVGFSNSRDTSRAETYRIRGDFSSQIDRYNQIKAGIEFRYTDLHLRYGNDDPSLRSALQVTNLRAFPLYLAGYLQDKLEFELMIATLGLRVDYLAPNGDWYLADNNPYDPLLAGGGSQPIEKAYPKGPVDPQLMLSPRLNVSFPVSDVSKIFFNYGHFRQIPTPIQMFQLRVYREGGGMGQVADPRAVIPRTIAYELGYEHSLFDEYLIRAAGYYKDEASYPFYVNYVDETSGVDYTRYTSRGYRDKRGFELSLYKNRGSWVQGFVNYTYEVLSSGNFGFAEQNANRNAQLIYEQNNPVQSKPIPQPYARLNIDFFTPPNLGDGIARYIFSDWRINFLASWRSGTYFTWAGGGSIPGLVNNVQWKDTWSADMRFQKTFTFGALKVDFIADVFNVLNLKQMAYASDIYSYGFTDGQDFLSYMYSLHLEDFPPPEFKTAIGYVNIPGDDRPGDYRDFGVEYQPIEAKKSYGDLIALRNPETRPFYYVAETGLYYQYVNGSWQEVDQGRLQNVLDTKAYIDMPNMETFWFLDPRKIYWGLRLSYEF